MGFKSELDVEMLDNDTWILHAPLVFESAVLGSIVSVPKGFTTDFASVPRLPIVYLLTGDTAHKAAVVHDFLYMERVVTRKQADQVLLEAMESTGISRWRRYSMYWAVRLFGSGHFGS